MQRPLLGAVFAFLLLSSCAQTSPPEVESEKLQHVYYHRRGGFAGVDDRVEVQPDGHVGIVKRGQPPHEYQLSRDQVRILRDAFNGWSSLRAEYPASEASRDHYDYEVRYGGRTVRGSDANTELPYQLRNVWMTIEAISQQ